MIVRVDDVSPNTRMDNLKFILNEMKLLPQITKVIVCVNLLSKSNPDGSVYPSPPFKSKALPFFYSVDKILNPMLLDTLGHVEIASHGLIHADHSVMCRRSQEMSIITSCNLLNTNTFVPPFNRYNTDTESICRINKVKLIKPEEGWKSLDYEVLVEDRFDPQHNLWYMHPWRWSIGKFKDKISSPLDRLVQEHTGASALDV